MDEAVWRGDGELGFRRSVGTSVTPLSALALMIELTHVGFGLMVPMAVAVVLATAVARRLDGYSIYSARLEGR